MRTLGYTDVALITIGNAPWIVYLGPLTIFNIAILTITSQFKKCVKLSDVVWNNTGDARTSGNGNNSEGDGVEMLIGCGRARYQEALCSICD